MKRIIKVNTLLIAIVLIMAGCKEESTSADAFGTFEAIEVIVSAESPGKLLAMDVSEGSNVEKGQLLAMVDTIQLYYQKGRLLAQRDALRSRLQNVPVQLDVFNQQAANLSKELERVKRLLESGAATQKQYDDMNSQLEVIDKQRAAIESQLSSTNRAVLAELKPLEWQLMQIEDGLDRCSIKSPIDGVVLMKYFSEGEIAAPGRPLLKMAAMDEMILRVYITGDQLGDVKIGSEVTVAIDGAEGVESGKLYWIADKAEFVPKTIQTKEERASNVYAAKIRVKNPEGRIKIGMSASVQFAE
ncbi:MAG: HlyD family efflux transporter periplasmic adaptor subunit [Cyclobacteriaceae bacterium]